MTLQAMHRAQLGGLNHNQWNYGDRKESSPFSLSVKSHLRCCYPFHETNARVGFSTDNE